MVNLKNIQPKSHPRHYMMHKYWGRKPHNVISSYIEKYTKRNDAVLDPFMGSGVVVIESLKLNRNAIGVDLNPVSCLITENTISKWDEENFIKEFNKIFEKNYSKFSDLYITKCPKCGKDTHFENSIWHIDEFKKIRGTCEQCGKFKKDTDASDLKTFKKAVKIFKSLDKENKIFYPKDEILKFVKRNGKTHFNMLFSERALVILGSIILDIKKVKNKQTKKLLLMVFTSMLPNVSKMIPGNEDNVNGRSGWVISKIWSPKIHTEKNIFNSFKERFKKILNGKKEIDGVLDASMARIYAKTAENLYFIETESIDYIFTDPPYGDTIAYLGLSMFWNSWLQSKVNYNKEIIYDPYRNKKYDDYQKRMERVFTELYRVLKNKKKLSFTFHNRNLKIWKIVIDAVLDAGFHLDEVVYQQQAVSSGTQGLNRKNTLRGDFIYTFIKNTQKKPVKTKKSADATELIKKHVRKWIKEHDNILTSDKLYEKLIPLLVENNAYIDSDGNIVNIEKELEKYFSYVEEKKNNKITYGWKE